MTALADAMAERRNVQPISDDVLSHIGISDFSLEALAEAMLGPDVVAVPPGNQSVEHLMAGLAIGMVVPADLDHVPADKLVDFRARFAGERAAFQGQIRAMIRSLDVDGISDADALRDHLHIQYEKLAGEDWIQGGAG